MSPALVISSLTAVAALLAFYTFLVPKVGYGATPKAEKSDKKILNLASNVGGELYAALPASFAKRERKKKDANPRLESLIVRSGNPWNLKSNEFINYQLALAVIGVIVAGSASFLLKDMVNIPWWVYPVAGGLFGFYIPTMKYNDEAKRRDLEFKRQLPEALDLLIISLAGGRTFEVAVREVIPNMKDGVLKEEFKSINKQLSTGSTLNEALDKFASRAPNQGIEAFIKSVKMATEVNSPMVETLEARADASRKEFFALIQQKIAQLPSKISMALAPTFLPAVLIVSVAPSIMSMMESMG